MALYALEAGDIQRLGRLLVAYESGRLKAEQGPSVVPIVARIETYLAEAVTAITASNGDTLGSGTVKVIKLEEQEDETWKLADGTSEYTAYNRLPAVINAESLVVLVREPVSGQLLVVAAGVSVCEEYIVPPLTCEGSTLVYQTRWRQIAGGLIVKTGMNENPCVAPLGWAGPPPPPPPPPPAIPPTQPAFVPVV